MVEEAEAGAEVAHASSPLRGQVTSSEAMAAMPAPEAQRTTDKASATEMAMSARMAASISPDIWPIRA